MTNSYSNFHNIAFIGIITFLSARFRIQSRFKYYIWLFFKSPDKHFQHKIKAYFLNLIQQLLPQSNSQHHAEWVQDLRINNTFIDTGETVGESVHKTLG